MNRQDLDMNNDAMIQAVINAKLYLQSHKQHNFKEEYLVAVNFHEPSYRKRLYFWDIQKDELISAHHCAHGEGSSAKDKAYCNKFSNIPDSHKSCIGGFKAGAIYQGKHGRSMKLHGLDKTNDNAYTRAIVVHKANYVTDQYIINNGRAGQSWGCFVLDPAIINKIIDKIHDGYLLFAYY